MTDLHADDSPHGAPPSGSVVVHGEGGASSQPVAQAQKKHGHSDALFLLFSIAGLGQCALPIEAVQVVTSADGPFRSVPGCGGSGSRFLGLVSVRGQLQLLFDLTRLPDANAVGSPPLAREEHLVVAMATCGRALALRVTEPLRLVRRQPGGKQESPQGELAALVCDSFGVDEPARGAVWLLSANALFAFLEREVRNG